MLLLNRVFLLFLTLSFFWQVEGQQRMQDLRDLKDATINLGGALKADNSSFDSETPTPTPTITAPATATNDATDTDTAAAAAADITTTDNLVDLLEQSLFRPNRTRRGGRGAVFTTETTKQVQITVTETSSVLPTDPVTQIENVDATLVVTATPTAATAPTGQNSHNTRKNSSSSNNNNNEMTSNAVKIQSQGILAVLITITMIITTL